jgi:hypothetical protein
VERESSGGFVSVQELEVRLLKHLGMPRSADLRPAGLPRLEDLNKQVRRVRSDLQAAAEHARSVGQIPPDYPAHVDSVMRVIARLLPWYTRPLRNFSEASAQALTSIGECIVMLADRQNILAAEVKRLSERATEPCDETAHPPERA